MGYAEALVRCISNVLFAWERWAHRGGKEDVQVSLDDVAGPARVADVPSLPRPWTHAAGDNVSPVAVSTAARLWCPADDAPPFG